MKKIGNGLKDRALRTLGIEEGVPYIATLDGISDEGQVISVEGIVSIKVSRRKGILFDLRNANAARNSFWSAFPEDMTELMDGDYTLNIPSQDFIHPVNVHRVDFTDGVVQGDVQSIISSALKSVTSVIKGLPERFGNVNQPYVQWYPSTSSSALNMADFQTFLRERSSMSRLGKVEMQMQGWRIVLQEIPTHLRSKFGETYELSMSREDSFTSEQAEEQLLALELFLSFLASRPVAIIMSVGHSGAGSDEWATVNPTYDERIFTDIPEGWVNWRFGENIDIENFFANFCKEEEYPVIETLIRRYVNVQLLLTAGFFESAFEGAMSLLEGVAKLVLSKSKIKAGQTRKVFHRALWSLGLGNPRLGDRCALAVLWDARSGSAHMELDKMEEGAPSYYHAQSTLMLVEFLLAARWSNGKEFVFRNRTVFPTFTIMGKDMYAKEREHEVIFQQEVVECKECYAKPVKQNNKAHVRNIARN